MFHASAVGLYTDTFLCCIYIYTVFRKKTHSHFNSYLHDLFVDLNMTFKFIKNKVIFLLTYVK